MAGGASRHSTPAGGKHDPEYGLVDPAGERAHKLTQPKPAVTLLFFDISEWPQTAQLVSLSAGVFFFFMLNGVVEEYVFTSLPERFDYGWYLTLFELLSFSGFAVVQRAATDEGAGRGGVLAREADYSSHLWVALAMTASRGLTNVSLEYLNYPTQVIFKSTKLMAVMAASVIVLAKRYDALQWVAAALLVLSATFFSLGDVAVAPQWSEMGIVIVVLSLVADAGHSISQDLVMNKHRASVLETMLFTNFFGACCTLVVLVAKGELAPAVAFCHRHPQAYVLFVGRAFIIYCGVLCFAQLIKRFDVVLATAITTVRKILTILLSFVLYPKPFTPMYVVGMLVFLGGVGVQTYHRKQTDPRLAAAPARRRSVLTYGSDDGSDDGLDGLGSDSDGVV